MGILLTVYLTPGLDKRKKENTNRIEMYSRARVKTSPQQEKHWSLNPLCWARKEEKKK